MQHLQEINTQTQTVHCCKHLVVDLGVNLLVVQTYEKTVICKKIALFLACAEKKQELTEELSFGYEEAKDELIKAKRCLDELNEELKNVQENQVHDDLEQTKSELARVEDDLDDIYESCTGENCTDIEKAYRKTRKVLQSLQNPSEALKKKMSLLKDTIYIASIDEKIFNQSSGDVMALRQGYKGAKENLNKAQSLLDGLNQGLEGGQLQEAHTVLSQVCNDLKRAENRLDEFYKVLNQGRLTCVKELFKKICRSRRFCFFMLFLIIMMISSWKELFPHNG